MDSSKLVAKFYLTHAVKLHDVVPVLHSWIQMHSIADHMLIDVADYAHVPNGPGVVLVADEANYYIDSFDGRVGLSYWRKRPLDGSFSDRLHATFRATLEACLLLESSPLGAKFDTREASFRINDRLLAPNTPQTLAEVKPDLEKFARELFGGNATLEHHADPKRLFDVTIRATAASDLETLLSRVRAPQTSEA